MLNVYAIMGVSSAGKDTVYGLLEDHYATQGEALANLKFSAPMKEVLEYLYGLRPGTLEDRQKRLQTVPGTSKTYLDLLREFYYLVPTVDPNMMVQKTMRDAEEYLWLGAGLAFTDIRNFVEVEVIQSLCERHGLTLTVIEVYRPGTEPLDTDQKLRYLMAKLRQSSQFHLLLRNDGTLEALRLKLATSLNFMCV